VTIAGLRRRIGRSVGSRFSADIGPSGERVHPQNSTRGNIGGAVAPGAQQDTAAAKCSTGGSRGMCRRDF
jgi:hypothetical protein